MEHLILWHRAIPPARGDYDDPIVLVRWTEGVAAAWNRAGGRSIAVVGSSLVAAFDVSRVTQALTASLALLDEAERMDPALAISFGAALGEVDVSTIPRGSAFDRAELLAHRARPGELALDPDASEVAGSTFLFGRTVSVGPHVPWHGQAIDRIHPERAWCLPQVALLESFQLPQALPPSIERLRETAAGKGAQWVVLRGRVGGGAEEWVSALAASLHAPLVLWIQAVPGALEPLGSLRLALLRRWGTPQAVAEALGGTPAADVLARIARGHAVTRADAIRALQTLLAMFSDDRTRAWLVLHPFTSVDPATREVVALATIRAQADSLVIAKVAADTALPKGLEQMVAADLRLPDLDHATAVTVAQQVLGPATAPDIAERVATIAGSTPLALVETARALVGRGDLVHLEDRFVWRKKAVDLGANVPVASLIADRLSGLDDVAMRILQIVSVSPSGSPHPLLWNVMRRDGIDGEKAFEAISRLREGQFLLEGDPLHATSAILRAVTFESASFERIASLQRCVADAMAEDEQPEAFSAATRGFFLHESGNGREGAIALLHAGFSASKQGFVRAAMRLAAAAVEFDPSPATQKEAALLTQATPSTPPAPAPASVPPPVNRPVVEESELSGAKGIPPSGNLARQTVDAILRGNFEAADHTIDVAVAEGCNPAAADRLRAVAYLVRGDMPSAVMMLARAHEAQPRDDGGLVRNDVARTLVLLHGGQHLDALRTGLRALGAARALGDSAGERATMHALAAVYEAAGRSADAQAILGTRG